MKRSFFVRGVLFTVSAFTSFAACADLEENPDAASVETVSSALVGVMSYGNCTAAEITKLNAAVAILVEITGTQNSTGFRYPAYEACLASADFVENGSWSGVQIANQLRTNKVTGIWCADLPSNVVAQAFEKLFYDEEVYFNRSFIASLPPPLIAGTIGHELMHNRGFWHSVNDFGSLLYPNTVPEQVRACILNGVSNPMPEDPPINNSPWGYLEKSTTLLSGWVCDQDDYSRPIGVHFYATHASGSNCSIIEGETTCYVGETTANREREPAVANNCGGNAFHGFRWNLPEQLLTGVHKVYAKAINYPVGANLDLQASPAILP